MTTHSNYMIRACGLIIGVSLAAMGCNNHATHELETLFSDMSPGFETVALSHDQRVLRHARTFNTHQRQLNDDLDMIMLIDRPLRMSPYPIP